MMKPVLKTTAGASGLLALMLGILFLLTPVSAQQADTLPLAPALQSPIKRPPAPELQQFIFGAPEVILSHTAPIGIVGWSPDSTKVLLTMQQPGAITETISIFDRLQLSLQSCGQRRSINSHPIPLWATNSSKVAYITFSEQQNDLWLSSCTGTPEQSPVLYNVGNTLTGYGHQALALDLAQKQARFVDRSGRSGGILPIHLQSMGFTVDNVRTSTQMEWSPSGDKLAIFDEKQFVILDLSTRKANYININQKGREVHTDHPYRVLHAFWSTDSRSVALIVTSTALPVNFSDLIIVDTKNAGLTIVHPPSLAGNEHFVTNVAWSANNRSIAVLFKIERDDQGFAYDGLFIVDSMTGQYKRILPDDKFGAGTWGWSLSWDKTGEHLLVSCPTRIEGRLCSVTVTTVQ